MNLILLFLFYTSLISLIIGPFGLIPLGFPSVNIYLLDLVMVMQTIIWLMNPRLIIEISQKNQFIRFFGLFCAVAFLSFVFSPIPLLPYEKIVAFLYFIRLASYSSTYFSLIYLIDKNILTSMKILRWLGIIGLIYSLVGWLQYFLYPDLRNLSYLGWDPHYMRIFGTFFDPNYFGIMLVLSLIVTYIQLKTSVNKWIKIFIIFATLVFTYSRSSFMALLAATFYYSSSIDKLKTFLTVTAILFVSVYLLPRPFGEGVKLERLFTIEGRVQNWKQGLDIFVKHPILGVGFNATRYAKRPYDQKSEEWLVNHSGAGFDSSYIFVLVATGMIGIIVYIFIIAVMILQSNKLVQASIVAVATHSLFMNSWFFPWVMLWIWMLLATQKSKEQVSFSKL